MKHLIAILFLIAPSVFGATWYVSTSGNDTTGTGAIGSPYRTIGKAHTSAAAGDTIELAAGQYDEHTSITKSNLVLLSTVPGMAGTKHVRIQASGIKIDGVRFERFSDQQSPDGQSRNANVRIETASSGLILTNCVFTNAVYAVGTNFSFISGSPTNAIYNPTIDFTARGFGTNSHIYIGASGWTNLYPAVHNTEWLVHSISGDGHTMFVTNAALDSFPVDTGTNWFAAISAGNGSEVLYSVYGVVNSGAYPTNVTIVNCTFDGIFGAPWYAYFNGALISNNVVGMHFGYRTIALQGRNMEICYNQFKRYRSYLRYTQQEIQNLVHPPGADWFDDASSEISAFEDAITSTNNSFHHNYCIDWNNQMGLADPRLPSATNEISGLYITNNVFVGITEHFSGGRNDMWFKNNTFYKCAYEFGEGHALTLGSGGAGSTPVTNLVITQNVFVDCGDHSGGTNFGNDRGFYSVSTNAVSPIVGSNWVAAAEVLQYQGKTTFTETNGVNGGDPTFQDPENPLGADGIPWTDDDGLRPIPGSRLALLGWGALGPPTNSGPRAYFRMTSLNTWLDDNTTNYSPSWVALKPWDRAVLGAERQYQTPDPIGYLPCTLTLTLTNSFDGTSLGMSNIVRWMIDWGDGARTYSATPWNPATASHTYVTTGTNTITLYVTNYAGQSDTFTRSYRILTNNGSFTNKIWFVDKLAGSDANSGTGSWASAYASLQKVGTNAGLAAGDIVAARGIHTEWTDITKAGSASNPIRWLGYGVTNGGFRVRQPDHQFVNWYLNATNSPEFSGIVRIFDIAHRTKFTDSIITDMIPVGDPGHLDRTAFYWVRASGVAEVGQSASSCLFSNLIINGINDIAFGLFGSSNEIAYNEFRDANYQADFARPFGQEHRIHHNYLHDVSTVVESHTDFIQVFGYQQGTNEFPDPTEYITAKNIYVYNNYLSNFVGQLGQFETFQNPTNQMTNIVFANNLLIKIKDKGSLGVSGIKLVNNGWYYGPYSNGNTFVGGSAKGNSYGAFATNNIFWLSGTDTNNNTQGWYGGSDEFMYTNGNFAADYNYVFPTKRLPPPSNNAQRWGSYSNAAEVHGINGLAPGFVSEVDGLFVLTTNSTLATNGFNMASAFAAWGIPLTDFSGRARSSSNAWAIGPMESGITVTGGGGGGGGGSTNSGRSWIGRLLNIQNLIVNQ